MPQQTVTFSELEYALISDSWYGFEEGQEFSNAKVAIENLETEYANFDRLKDFLKCWKGPQKQATPQAKLIRLWCVVAGLPAYRDKEEAYSDERKPLDWRPCEYAERWTDTNIAFRLDELRQFFEKTALPLPNRYFHPRDPSSATKSAPYRNDRFELLIQGRRAVPVRLAPFFTAWSLHPQRLVNLLRGKEPIRYGGIETAQLQAYRVDSGRVREIQQREWNRYAASLTDLEQRFCEREKSFTEWDVASVKELPAGAFVWHDELQEAVKHVDSCRKDQKAEKKVATSLIADPLLPIELNEDFVFDGFHHLMAPAEKNVPSFHKARRILDKQWQATVEEIAIWIWHEDLKAWWHARNPNGPPVPFFFLDAKDESDYRKTLVAVFFSEAEITAFKPEGRYLTGSQVIERWAVHGDKTALTETLRVHSGAGTENLNMDLLPLHPMDILERPIEDCLFAVHQIERFEREHFPNATQQPARTIKKKLLPVQQDKLDFQKLCRAYWKGHPIAPITGPNGVATLKAGGYLSHYKQPTLDGWAREIAPEGVRGKRGRPKRK